MEQWKDWPIYVWRTDLDVFVLPTLRDFAALDEQRRRYEVGIGEAHTLLAKLESELGGTNQVSEVEQNIGVARERIRQLELTLVNHDAKVEQVRKAVDERIPSSTLMSFQLRYPTFDEYLRADELARDWHDDIPRVNNGRMARALLANHVKLDGVVLSETEIGKLDYAVANSLWSEMQSMAYPNYERLPFTSTPSMTTKPEL